MVKVGAVLKCETCRTSHEVRGLKYILKFINSRLITSHLTRGAWIEIIPKGEKGEKGNVAPHTRCVD